MKDFWLFIIGRQEKPSNQGWSPRFLLSLGVLVLFWAVESFLVQASIFDAPPSAIKYHVYLAVRLLLNIATALIVCLLFRRRWLLAIIALDFLINCMNVAYGCYFHHALSVFYEISNLKEGLKVSGFALQVIPPHVWAALISALAIKIVFAFRITPQPLCFRKRGAALGLITIAVLFAALQFSSFQIYGLRRFGATRMVYAYGYLNTWIAEFFFSSNLKEVGDELKKLQTVSPDRLASTEPEWPVGRNVVVVQMESVGWNIVGYKLKDQFVMPYLSSLAKNSRTFEIRSYHDLGSSDMDYATLSEGTPSSRAISYSLPDVHYADPLPEFMQKHGFYTAAFHGNDGHFFDRMVNYQRMGFDEIWFKNELLAKEPMKQSSWGVRDSEVFRFSSEKLRSATAPQFHFIITLDSHAPFNLIGEEEKTLFPHTKVWQEDFFNSMRVLDTDIRKYVESLPAGTIVVLYGDHTSGVSYGDFHSARRGIAEYIPCIIHECKSDNSWLAKFDTKATLPQDLRIIDVMNQLRRQIAQQIPAMNTPETNIIERLVQVSENQGKTTRAR